MPTPRKSINRKQLAQLAGVSPAVVTAGMQNRPSTIAVSAETRERVLRLGKEHHYQRDIIGLSLSSQRTFLLGIIFQETMRFFMWEIIHGLEAMAAENDYALLVFPTPICIQGEAQRVQRALNRKVDGLVCLPVLDEKGRPNLEMYQSIQANGTALVQLYGEYLPGVPSIRSDQFTAGKIATEHLIELGHRRILHFGQKDEAENIAPDHLKSTYLSKQGYLQAMKEAGLKPMIFETDADKTPSLQNYQASAPLIANHPGKPTAVFCTSDGRAFGLLKGLQHLGIQVPAEMSVIGIDNTIYAPVTTPPLTSVDTFRVNMGRLAGEVLLDTIAGKKVESTIIKPDICIRESCAAI